MQLINSYCTSTSWPMAAYLSKGQSALATDGSLFFFVIPVTGELFCFVNTQGGRLTSARSISLVAVITSDFNPLQLASNPLLSQCRRARKFLCFSKYYKFKIWIYRWRYQAHNLLWLAAALLGLRQRKCDFVPIHLVLSTPLCWMREFSYPKQRWSIW